ncbi:MAG: DsbA family protein [Acidimicrobiia bacterium]|nr:DsbA family protein [Acidimicrobiia bacterium]
MTQPASLPGTLIIFGDFNCPYSALASHRAGTLERSGETVVDWRGVQHLPDQPLGGKPVTGDIADMYTREVEQIRSLLLTTEEFPLKVPPVQPNTGLAIAGLALTETQERSSIRERIFEAFWLEGRDIGDPDILAELEVPSSANLPTEMTRWQQQWESFDNRMIPMLELPDGYVSKGLGALKRLADWIIELDIPLQ